MDFFWGKFLEAMYKVQCEITDHEYGEVYCGSDTCWIDCKNCGEKKVVLKKADTWDPMFDAVRLSKNKEWKGKP